MELLDPFLLVLFVGVLGMTNQEVHIKTIQNTTPPQSSGVLINPEEKTAEYWNKIGKSVLKKQLQRKFNTGSAKNVIMFLGDGMSIATLAAARVYLGKKLNASAPGEEVQLSFEKFPFVGLSKTYCVNFQVADSACSATAYLSGVKANEATIGVTAAVDHKNCTAMKDVSNHVYSIARKYQLKGKMTGLVTTTRVTHASPAGVYAHTANRYWEYDGEVKADGANPEDCPDIAHQLIYGDTGRELNVVFGGGRLNFIPRPAKDEDGSSGLRQDGINLIEEWKKQKKERNKSYEYVFDKAGLAKIPDTTSHVLGLFASSHLDYNLDRNVDKQPSLQEMTETAVKLLSNSGNDGFFLFVEGGRIDHAHHANWPRKALDETVEFHKAIESAYELTNPDDTLIVVTADHSHTLTLNGYPHRGSDVLGIGGTDRDNLPYLTLSYANGPGYKPEQNGKRPDISNDNISDKDYVYPAMVPLKSETHGGEDVGVFASGPQAHLLSGVIEQNVIAHVMVYASCVDDDDDNPCRSSGVRLKAATYLLFVPFLCISLVFCERNNKLYV